MNIALYGKLFDLKYRDTFQQFIDKLESNDVNISVYEPFYHEIRDYQFFKKEPRVFTKHEDIRYFVNVMISVGGDGTFLNSITLVRDANIPVLGLNFGRLGFLSSIARQNIILAIDLLLQKKYEIDERALINVDTTQNLFGDLNFGLNDLTVHKYNTHSLIVIDVYVDGSFLNSYWADGLILSTPTGSTGYSLSCSGPIVSPDTRAFIITPIATHNLTVRPIVLPDESVITLKMRGREEKFHLALDSRVASVDASETITVRKESFPVKLVKMPDESFFNTMREKLNWGLDIRN